jgi:hypothetical protein
MKGFACLSVAVDDSAVVGLSEPHGGRSVGVVCALVKKHTDLTKKAIDARDLNRDGGGIRDLERGSVGGREPDVRNQCGSDKDSTQKLTKNTYVVITQAICIN